MVRVLALDPGSVRIGVALSDPLRITAQPHSSLTADDPELFAKISALIVEKDVNQVIVGLPLSLDGSEGASAAMAREFAASVAKSTGVDVQMVDERFSTVMAERVMIEAGARRSKRRAARDRVAAAIFLQSYLDGIR